MTRTQTPDEAWDRLPIAIEKQARGNLCWAAVASAVSRFYDPGSPWTQARVAQAAPGGEQNQLWYATDALALCGVLEGRLERPLELGELAAEVRGGRPVAARIRWDFGGGHLVLLTGASAGGGVWIEDPEHGPAPCTLHDLREGNYRGFGRWTHTYLTRRPA